jgi:hypothetical protein
LKTFNGITIQVEFLCRRQSNVYAEDIQQHKTSKLNCYAEDSLLSSKLNGYAEDIQRGITIQDEIIQRHSYECLSRRQSNVYAKDIQRHKYPS